MQGRAERFLLGSCMRRQESCGPLPEPGVRAARLFEIRLPPCRRQVQARVEEVLLAIVVVFFTHSVASAHATPRPLGRVRRSCARTARRARTPSRASP